MSNFEQCLLGETKQEKAHSVSENGSSSTFRWITVQHCYNTLAEPSKLHQTIKLLSQFMALTALLCGIIAATRNKFVLIHFFFHFYTTQENKIQSQTANYLH